MVASVGLELEALESSFSDTLTGANETDESLSVRILQPSYDPYRRPQRPQEHPSESHHRSDYTTSSDGRAGLPEQEIDLDRSSSTGEGRITMAVNQNY